MSLSQDMTYAKQLRDYENAVIQKRFEELNTDEVDAMMDEIYPEKPPHMLTRALIPPVGLKLSGRRRPGPWPLCNTGSRGRFLTLAAVAAFQYYQPWPRTTGRTFCNFPSSSLPGKLLMLLARPVRSGPSPTSPPREAVGRGPACRSRHARRNV